MCYGDDPEVPFEEQAERIVSAWFLAWKTASRAFREEFDGTEIAATSGLRATCRMST
jgi:hypothetical protein